MTRLVKNEDLNLKENKKGSVGGLGGSKVKGEMI